MRRKRRYDTSAAAVPDWWIETFLARQAKIRNRVHQVLRLGPLTTNGVRQHINASYEKAEIEHALASLAAEGRLDCESRTEPTAHGSRVSRDFTYWRLPGHPAAAAVRA